MWIIMYIAVMASLQAMGLEPGLVPIRTDDDDRAQYCDHVSRLGHQRCALFDQIVAAFGARVQRRARDGKYLPALLEPEVRGDERARAPGRLHHDDSGANAGNESIATGKVSRAGLMAEWHFRNKRALRQNRLRELGVFGRIETVMPAGEDGDGARGQTRAMRRRVDAAGEPGHYG